MDRDNQRLVWIAAAVLLAAVVAILLVPRARERLAPAPERAFVAIQAEGEEVARSGAVELAGGSAFTLHAVLAATAGGGGTVYYTEAPALEIAGQRVPQQRLLRWERTPRARVLWFTVEGSPPYVPAGDSEAVAAFRFQEIFRADWPQAWSIPGSVEPTSERLARGRKEHGPFPFGTSRFQVRVLLYGPESAIRPRRRFISPGAEELAADPDAVPYVRMRLPGLLAAASGAFGLPQLEPDATGELPERLASLVEQGLAFRRAHVLDATLQAAGRRWPDLAWQEFDPREGPAWGADGAGPGHFVRSGSRVVILYRDDGDGRLGEEDLAFDLVSGPAVRPLGETFVGDGLLEWAALEAATQ